MAARADPIREFADQQAEVARQTRSLRAQLEAQRAEIMDLRRMLDFVRQVDETPIRPATWKQPRAKSKGHGIVTVMLTDTHFDEVVKPEQVGGMNAYDRRIAELRLRRWSDHVITLASDYVAGIAYDGCQIMLGGDLFSGTIHQELRETNAATLFESVVHWLDPLLSALRQQADVFGHVHIGAVVGNHGRMTRKPVAKNRAQDNIEWLMLKVLQRELKADQRFTVEVSDAADLRVFVYGTRYLLTHGDQFRGGSGISGALSPLMIGQARKIRRELAAGQPFDWLVMGHWHQYWVGKRIIVGGTLKGVDEYGWIGNFEPEPPSQAWWITDPEHGVTISAPVHVMDRKAEGW